MANSYPPEVAQARLDLRNAIDAFVRDVSKYGVGADSDVLRAIDHLIATVTAAQQQEIERLTKEVEFQKRRANENAIRATGQEERAERLQIVRDDCVRSEVALIHRAEAAEARVAEQQQEIERLKDQLGTMEGIAALREQRAEAAEARYQALRAAVVSAGQVVTLGQAKESMIALRAALGETPEDK